MKRYLLSLLVVFIAVSLSYSQSTVMLTKETYREMKLKGQIKNEVKYIPIGDNLVQKDSLKIPVRSGYTGEVNYPKSINSSNDCSCMVPRDSTFSTAEFTEGVSPGYSPDYRCDDAFTEEKALPFNFCLYGTQYDSVFINSNGNITFGEGYSTFSASAFPSTDFIMVAPFWGDVETNNFQSGLVYYKITSTYMIVKWENVGYFDTHADKKNTFQLIITDGNDPILPSGNNIAFCYGDMQWTTGDASDGVNGFGGIPATVGVNKGDGTNYVQVGRFDKPGTAYDGGYGADDGVSWLDYQSFYFNSCSGANIPPIANGLNNCDTIRICGVNDTLILNGLFLAPEIGQNTTVSVNLNGTAGATVIGNNSGNAATTIVQVIASSANAGNNIITFTATDDGIPAATTTVNVNVFVDTTGISNFNPVISGDLEICEGETSLLSVSPTTYDSYSWSNGSDSIATYVSEGGPTWVTAKFNGCYKSSLVNMVVHEIPDSLIVGPLFTCNTNPTTLGIDSISLYPSHSWLAPTASTADSITLLSGQVIVMVTDAYGCIGYDTADVINANPEVSISGAQTFCPGSTITLQANPTFPSGAIYTWSNNTNAQTTNISSAGTYTVTVNYSNGCSATNSVLVNQYPAPDANYVTSPSGSAPPGTLISFTDMSTISSGSITTWVWNFGDSINSISADQNPNYTYSENGEYIVTLAVRSDNGCWDTIQLKYLIMSDIEIPNVFTPNGDGINDVLAFKNLEFFQDVSLIVYNRWGNKVYEASNYKNDWPGEGHDGTYYFVLQGTSLTETKYGFVQVIKK